MTVLSFLAIYLIWGSSFLAIRFALESWPPFLMMGARCTLAGAVLFLVGLARGEFPRPRHLKPALLAGVLMITLPYASLAWAEQRISSGMAALLVATVPLWLVGIEWMRGTRPSRRRAVGFGLGFAGVVLLVAGTFTTPGGSAPVAAIIVSELAWAMGSVYLQPRLPRPLTLMAGLPMTIGGLLLLAGSVGVGELHSFRAADVTPLSAAAVVYLIVFGSIVAFSAYMYLLRVMPASSVSTHAFVNPVIAVALGSMFGHEPLTWNVVAATAVIAAGVALVILPAGRLLAPRPRPAGAKRMRPIVPIDDQHAITDM